MGIVIGETCEIGDNVTLYQGVTLGGTGKHEGKRHPTIEDDVLIGAGAKVLGPFTVHKGAKIGAGSMVLKEVPAGCTVVGNPGRLIKCCEKKIESPNKTMDQVHLPDPIRNELDMLKRRLDLLEKEKNTKDKE